MNNESSTRPHSSWYLIYAKPSSEEKARDQLVAQGYEVFLPTITIDKRLRGKLKKVTVPLFPRYLFVHLTEGVDNFSPIRSTIGVANMIRFGGKSAIVPDSLVAALQLRDSEEDEEILEQRQFKPGDKVQIVEGPFADYDAIFKSHSGGDRICILLQIAERETQLKLRISDIDAAE